jgi:hypothetical protein
MTVLNLQDVFGQGVQTQSSNGGVADTLVINLLDFQDIDNGGEMPNGTGWFSTDVFLAEQILAAILIRLKSKLPTNINSEPEQAVYITEGTKGLATGARNGQFKKSYTVTFFIDAQLGDNIPIYRIGRLSA